jgi:hypothetical protein
MRFTLLSCVPVVVAVAAVALSACSSGSLPVAPTTFAASAVHVSSTSAEMTIFPNAACDRKKLELCVTQGKSSTLGIKLTCRTSTGAKMSCGTIHWKAVTSNAGLRASFDPAKEAAPKDTTVETVRASETVKPGKYHQTITATASTVPKPAKGKFPITVEAP